ncbi:MAG: hypothetical protein MUC58_11525 [Rhizobiaceae bacterium]|jgi:hypothetical protein|nr:hypothetical protein [Rhizobiaceae bacterium]
MRLSLIALASAAILAAGCTPEPGQRVVAANTVSTPPPFGAPAQTPGTATMPTTPAATAVQPVPNGVNRTNVTERTIVEDDGTVRTEKTTVSFGFSQPTVAAAPAIVAPAAFNTGIAGGWKLQSSATKAMCDVNLYGGPGATSGEAASNCMGYDSMRGVNGWRYVNGQLELLRGPDVALAFNQLGPNRFDTQHSWMGLTTTLALYR